MQTENVKYENRYDKAINNVEETKKKLDELKANKSNELRGYTHYERKLLRDKRIINVVIILLMITCAFFAFRTFLARYSTFTDLMSDKKTFFISVIIGIVWVVLAILLTSFNARAVKRRLKNEKEEHYRLDGIEKAEEKAESELAERYKLIGKYEALIHKAEEVYEEAIQMKRIAAENTEDEAAARKFRSKMDYAFEEGSVKARKFVGKEKYDEATSGVHELSENSLLLAEAISLGCEEAIAMYAGLLFSDATSGKYTNAEKAEKFKEVDKLLTQEVTAANKDALFLKKFLKYYNGDISSDELTDYLHYLRDIEKEHSLSESLNPLVPDLISSVVSKINRRNTVTTSYSPSGYSLSFGSPNKERSFTEGGATGCGIGGSYCGSGSGR